MTITEFLKKHKIKQNKFARAINVCPTVLNHYIKGRRRPSIDLAQKIIEVTKGEVTLAGLVG